MRLRKFAVLALGAAALSTGCRTTSYRQAYSQPVVVGQAPVVRAAPVAVAAPPAAVIAPAAPMPAAPQAPCCNGNSAAPAQPAPVVQTLPPGTRPY